MSKNILIIAGLDPSGGAGIQADILTAHHFGLHPLPVVSAITAQNNDKFFFYESVSEQMLTAQVLSATDGQKISAIKMGMIGSLSNVLWLADFLTEFLSPQKNIPVVIDPLLRSSTGAMLLEEAAIPVLCEKLLPLATVVTPNIPEAEFFLKRKIQNVEEQKKAAEELSEKWKSAVVLKGGHLSENVTDVLFDGKLCHVFSAEKIAGSSPRGTGCRFASAVAALLAKEIALKEAISQAKDYVHNYISLTHKELPEKS